MSTEKLRSLSEAAQLVPDGARLGFGGGNAMWRRPVSFVRELVRQQSQDLHVFNMIAGIETDLLLGAELVASTNSCYVGLDEFGQSPHFQRVARDGSVTIHEYSEFTFVASLRAANMGLPFMPWRTAWGTDIAELRGWENIECPYTGESLPAIPANPLDVVVIQADRCDERGNVERTNPPDFIHDFDQLIARAADVVIVCSERIEPLEDPTHTVLIAQEVDAVVEAPRGGWPGGFIPHYPVDERHLEKEYLPATQTPEAFSDYLDRFVREGEVIHG